MMRIALELMQVFSASMIIERNGVMMVKKKAMRKKGVAEPLGRSCAVRVCERHDYRSLSWGENGVGVGMCGGAMECDDAGGECMGGRVGGPSGLWRVQCSGDVWGGRGGVHRYIVASEEIVIQKNPRSSQRRVTA